MNGAQDWPEINAGSLGGASYRVAYRHQGSSWQPAVRKVLYELFAVQLK